MFDTHTAANGDVSYIRELDTEHIVNIINLRIKRIETYQQRQARLHMTSVFQAHLYGGSDLGRDNLLEIADKTRGGLQALSPYLAEVWFRGMDLPEYRTRITQIMEFNISGTGVADSVKDDEGEDDD